MIKGQEKQQNKHETIMFGIWNGSGSGSGSEGGLWRKIKWKNGKKKKNEDSYLTCFDNSAKEACD